MNVPGRRLVPKANGKVCACGCGEKVVRAQKNAIYASYECKMKVDAKRQAEKKKGQRGKRRDDHLGRVHLKLVSNSYLEKEK